jgi:hypothetical protein
MRAVPFSFLIAAALFTSACTLWNRIDVCGAAPPAERTLNGWFPGAQSVPGPRAGTGLHTGRGLLVFAQPAVAVSGVPASQWILRITEGGDIDKACDPAAVGQVPHDKLVPVIGDDEQGASWSDAVAVGFQSVDSDGLIVIRKDETRADGTSRQSLWGQFIDSEACLIDSGLFPIASAGPEVSELVAPDAAGLTPDPAGATFLVSWIERFESGSAPAVAARIVSDATLGPKFFGTALSFAGEAVPVYRGAAALVDLGAVTLAPGLVALFWYENVTSADTSADTWQISGALFDDHLRQQQSFAVADHLVVGDVPQGRRMAVAWDGQHILVTWLAVGSGGGTRAYGRVLDGSGSFVARTGDPAGGPFLLGSASDVLDSRLAATALKQGGFLAAWRQAPTASADGDLRAVALDTDGGVRFNNRACDTKDFALNSDLQGDQEQAALVLLPTSGSVLAGWTDNGPNATDPNGSIRGVLVRPSDLFPDYGRTMVSPSVVDAASAGTPDAGVAIDTSNVLCRIEPGFATGLAPCRCDSDCGSGYGISCRQEAASGAPGGECIRRCTSSDPTTCGAGEVCLTNSSDGFPYCFTRCTAPADCPPGRACSQPGICVPICTRDSDCLSGNCNRYSGSCVTGTASQVGTGGLGASCAMDSDCGSGDCDSTTGTCSSRCQVSRPACPENAVCAEVRAGDDVGICRSGT